MSTQLLKVQGEGLCILASLNGSRTPDVRLYLGSDAGGELLDAGAVPVLDIPGREKWIDGIERARGKATGEELRRIVTRLAADVIAARAPIQGPPETDATAQPLDPTADREGLWRLCAPLATDRNLLATAADVVGSMGVTGARRQIEMVVLAMVSRLLPRPVSLVIKGPSASGKSYPLDQTLRLFPPESYEAWTAMSERALLYGETPLRHRMLVIYEAPGMGDKDGVGQMAMRSLLSEGRLKYSTVEKGEDGKLRAVEVEREGPTGLITTTTGNLHPENETRMLTFNVTDSKEQTRRIFQALAGEGSRTEPDLEPWHALQRWLAGGDNRVTIPYAATLADAMPDNAVRFRRDFGMLLNLIRAHAVLHQASRDRAADGSIIAALDDYAVVRDLVGSVIAEATGLVVSKEVRETVDAVAVLLKRAEIPGGTVTAKAIGDHLGFDKSTATRRAKKAMDRGYLRNEETGRYKPYRLALDEPMPEPGDRENLLPTVEEVARTVAGGDATAKSPSLTGLAPMVAGLHGCAGNTVGQEVLL